MYARRLRPQKRELVLANSSNRRDDSAMELVRTIRLAS